jgi:WD40 repeat protein
VIEASAADPITAVAVSPDGGALVTGGADRLVQIWGCVL